MLLKGYQLSICHFAISIIHDQYSYMFLFRQYHHHDIALLIDGTFKYLDVNPIDGLLEKSELARTFEDLDANSEPFYRQDFIKG